MIAFEDEQRRAAWARCFEEVPPIDDQRQLTAVRAELVRLGADAESEIELRAVQHTPMAEFYLRHLGRWPELLGVRFVRVNILAGAECPMAKKAPQAPKAPAPLVFRSSLWMEAEIPLNLRQRLRMLFGAPLRVRLDMPVERSPGRTGPVTGSLLVGKPPAPNS